MHHHTGKEKAESFLVFQQHTHHRPYQQAAEAPPGVGTSDRQLTGNHRGASTPLSHIPRRAQNAPIGAFLCVLAEPLGCAVHWIFVRHVRGYAQHV